MLLLDQSRHIYKRVKLESANISQQQSLWLSQILHVIASLIPDCASVLMSSDSMFENHKFVWNAAVAEVIYAIFGILNQGAIAESGNLAIKELQNTNICILVWVL